MDLITQWTGVLQAFPMALETTSDHWHSLEGLVSSTAVRGMKLASRQILFYREEILYTGIGFSSAAVLSVLVAKISLVVFFTVGSALCFGLAVWAFRTEAAKNAHQMLWVNARSLESGRDGEASVAEMNRQCDELQQTQKILEEEKKKLIQEIEELKRLNGEQALKIEELNALVLRLQEVEKETIKQKAMIERLLKICAQIKIGR